MDLIKDCQDLGVAGHILKPKFKLLEGTRQIIQYENPDYVFTLSKTLKPKVGCFGVTNRCKDGKFILFLDYDKIYKNLVYKNLDNLRRIFPNLFDVFYIATTAPEERLDDGSTKGSYHVISFIKQFKSQIKKVMEYCDVDPYFIKIPEKTAHKCHVLRVSEKYWKMNGKTIKEGPSFMECYPEGVPLLEHKYSKSHFIFFRKCWGIKSNLEHNFDNSKKVVLHKYSTAKGPEDHG